MPTPWIACQTETERWSLSMGAQRRNCIGQGTRLRADHWCGCVFHIASVEEHKVSTHDMNGYQQLIVDSYSARLALDSYNFFYLSGPSFLQQQLASRLAHRGPLHAAFFGLEPIFYQEEGTSIGPISLGSVDFRQLVSNPFGLLGEAVAHVMAPHRTPPANSTAYGPAVVLGGSRGLLG